MVRNAAWQPSCIDDRRLSSAAAAVMRVLLGGTTTETTRSIQAADEDRRFPCTSSVLTF
jgi:hypothetical protein